MPTLVAMRAETPSAPITSGAWKVCGPSSVLAVTPVTRPVRSSTMGSRTVTFWCIRAPALTARLASISSKSRRGRTSPKLG